jgi:hypothetical protein
MIVENVNTHAHGDVYLVVLAHLRRRWSLSGKDGVGTLSAGFGIFFGSVLHCFCALDAAFEGIGRWPNVRCVCRNSAAAEFAPARPVAREG